MPIYFQDGILIFQSADGTDIFTGVPAYIADILPETEDVKEFHLAPMAPATFTAINCDFDYLLLKAMIDHLPSRPMHLAFHHPKVRVRKKNRARLLKT